MVRNRAPRRRYSRRPKSGNPWVFVVTTGILAVIVCLVMARTLRHTGTATRADTEHRASARRAGPVLPETRFEGEDVVTSPLSSREPIEPKREDLNKDEVSPIVDTDASDRADRRVVITRGWKDLLFKRGVQHLPTTTPEGKSASVETQPDLKTPVARPTPPAEEP